MADEPTAGGISLIIEPDPAAAVARAASVFTAMVEAAAERAARVDVALTGGSTAPAFYAELAGSPRRDRIPWGRLHLWWGDDRFVRRDDPRSNVYPADRLLLGRGGAPIPVDQVHPTPCTVAVDEGRDPAWAAAAYAAELSGSLGTDQGQPVLDLVMLGIGPDGHLLSVFPGSAAFDRSEPVLAIPAPTHIEPHLDRITLNPAALGVARGLLVIATGAAKAGVLASILGGGDARALPGRLAVRPGAIWVLDEAAASSLG